MSEPNLRRVIGGPGATAMVVGTIIGASIFVQPSEITGRVPSVAGVFFVWLVAGVLTLFGALICAELASTFTRTGGVYVYLREAYSPAVGFLWGWAMFWSMHSGIIAAVAVVFARYAGWFVPLGDAGTRATAIGAIAVLSAINVVGVRQGNVLQAALTLAKLIAIVAIVAVGFALGKPAAAPLDVAAAAGGVSPREFVLAVAAGLFAFGGWHMVTYNADETIDPRRTIPRALALGVVIVTVSYIALNAVYLHVLPLDRVAGSTRVAADAADAVLGRGGGSFMSGLVVLSTFGALSGIILTGPRVYYAMARDGLLFDWVGAVHPRFRTPHRAILVQAVWSSALVLTGTYRALFTRVVYTEWIFFGLMALGLFVLRRRPDVSRGYGVWGYPVVPVLFALASFLIVVNQVVSDVRESVIGLLAVVAGLPVYHAWTHWRNRTR